ncbi:MAG: L,D-transpeptidase family protein [Bacteroidetes bacterium]|nr:L,D-transpeptidase family protein [Bacteroidota bacterium]
MQLRLLFILLFSLLIVPAFTQHVVVRDDAIVQKFYTFTHQKLYWLSNGRNLKRAYDWLSIIEKTENTGLNSNKADIDVIRNTFIHSISIDSLLMAQTDRQITSIILNYIKCCQQGNVSFDYDEVNHNNDTIFISQLLNFRKRANISKIIKKLECKDHDYLILKKFLNDSISSKDSVKYNTLLLALNYRRFLSFNHHTEYIVVNIPATEAEYYRNDSLLIRMRTVVGKTKTPTPTIASYITNIICFPNWNVPFSVAGKEILPKVQKNANYLEQHNFDVVDGKGNVIDDAELNWNSYNETNFPYYFRQSTGAENSLGVLKFNLQNPFSIFLHATSWQGAFAKEYRFLSHGCVRLEKPFELADFLLKGKIDIEELKKGKKNTVSSSLALSHKVAVFIIYMPLTVTGNKVSFLKDEYGLIK